MLGVFPNFIVRNLPNGLGVDLEFFRKALLRDPIAKILTHFSNDFFVQFSASVPCSGSHAHSPFGLLIKIVVQICSKKKMIWANALTVVTSVTNAEVFWKFAKGNRVTGPMGEARPVVSKVKHSVAASINGPLPLPAIIPLIDLFPKSIRHRPTRFHIGSIVHG